MLGAWFCKLRCLLDYNTFIRLNRTDINWYITFLIGLVNFWPTFPHSYFQWLKCPLSGNINELESKRPRHVPTSRVSEKTMMNFWTLNNWTVGGYTYYHLLVYPKLRIFSFCFFSNAFQIQMSQYHHKMTSRKTWHFKVRHETGNCPPHLIKASLCVINSI